ncbi:MULTISPECIES: alcohol dehydrogenase catalytic domain-containing protein [Microbacterium]|uniref:alcohol dehydrogenase catalytic domain-containing protein n=1 Tax=Microbacterium TaxID=33882 RepID=UPI00217E5196|nr:MULTISPECIES: alcohol dehydrogenase catalytic domain-containing protein [Microbacterium]WCM55408.1 alcohol dehydrogenase catalytic domain-containing protein [Microbacterium sp. EF45047]
MRAAPARPDQDPAAGRRQDIALRPPAVAMAFLGDRHETIAVPGVALAPDDVLVAVELSTICGSDVHTALGRRPASLPVVLGHESVGRVVARSGRRARMPRTARPCVWATGWCGR